MPIRKIRILDRCNDHLEPVPRRDGCCSWVRLEPDRLDTALAKSYQGFTRVGADVEDGGCEWPVGERKAAVHSMPRASHESGARDTSGVRFVGIGLGIEPVQLVSGRWVERHAKATAIAPAHHDRVGKAEAVVA